VKKIKCKDDQANNCDGNCKSGRRKHSERLFHFIDQLPTDAKTTLSLREAESASLENAGRLQAQILDPQVYQACAGDHTTYR
jgi:hypothetical protein